MGPLESKHVRHKRYLYATTEREKKSFLSRLRKSFFQKHTSSRKHDRKRSSASKHASEKSHRSRLREDHQIRHRKQDNERRRSKRQASEEERKKNRENSFRKLQSWRRIAEWSSSASSSRENIKAFFSRPMQDASVQKFVEKIKKRNELRKENTFKENVLETSLRRADEKFPSRRQVQRYKPQMRTKSDKITPLKKSISRVTNNDNEGKLFDENGLPFWSKFSKVQKDNEKKSEETTDEDLPMDSELLLEVQAGLRELVKMPKVRVVMDPYAPLDYLKSRDKIFFTTEIIFSNTVRSMVNLHDEISNKDIISKRNRRLGKIFIQEPIKVTQYNEDNPLIHEQILI